MAPGGGEGVGVGGADWGVASGDGKEVGGEEEGDTLGAAVAAGVGLGVAAGVGADVGAVVGAGVAAGVGVGVAACAAAESNNTQSAHVWLRHAESTATHLLWMMSFVMCRVHMPHKHAMQCNDFVSMLKNFHQQRDACKKVQWLCLCALLTTAMSELAALIAKETWAAAHIYTKSDTQTACSASHSETLCALSKCQHPNPPIMQSLNWPVSHVLTTESNVIATVCTQDLNPSSMHSQ